MSVTPEVGTNNIIAVRHSKLYQLISSSDLQTCKQDGGNLFLQREECPPYRPDQDLSWHLIPRWRKKHSRPVQVLHWPGTGKDLLFGQQYVCGVFSPENQHQPRLSKTKVYFSCTDFLRPDHLDQSKLLHQDHGPHHHDQWQWGDQNTLQVARLNLEPGTAVPAAGKQDGHHGHWQAPH